MKPNTKLLRRPLGRPRAACTLCTLNTSWHSAKKTKAHSSLAMLQECLCNIWGDPSATPSYEHRKEVRYTFYFQIEKTILYSSSSKHEVTFLKAVLNLWSTLRKRAQVPSSELEASFFKAQMLSSPAHCDHTWRQAAYTL